MPSHAELVRTGMTFTRAFANSCMCSPSRATLFTGRMPAEHGMVLTHTRDATYASALDCLRERVAAVPAPKPTGGDGDPKQ